LKQALEDLAASEIAVTEAYDRLRPWRAIQGRVDSARRSVERIRNTCRSGNPSIRPKAYPSLTLPGPGEVFFGRVTGQAPSTATKVLVNVNGSRVGSAAVSGGAFSLRVSVRPGQALVEALYVNANGRQVGAAVSRDAFALPASAARSPAAPHNDKSLSTRLAAAGLGFDGYASIHVERLATGAVAGWNDDARFPAASTVKLAVMIEAARRFGLAPSSPILYDVEQAAAWSSNLAANRLFELIGGGDTTKARAVAERRLRLVGAPSSTYPGEYRVGTARSASPRQPPLQTARVTTARDLAAVMRAIHLSAVGKVSGLRATGLRPEAARVLLRALLGSVARSDNAGLVKPYLPTGTPFAQKNGWVSDSRSTAGIIYGREGPVIVVIQVFRSGGLSLAQAQLVGKSAARIAAVSR
jgi:beta-lactamase class A